MPSLIGIVLVAFTICGGCGTRPAGTRSGPSTAPAGPEPARNDPAFEVKLAVFRHMFEAAASPRGPVDYETYAVRDARAGELVVALKQRAAKVLGPAGLLAWDAGTEWAPGLVIYSAGITSLTDERAVVAGGWYSGPRSALWYTYQLRRDATGQWVIEEEHLDMIS